MPQPQSQTDFAELERELRALANRVAYLEQMAGLEGAGSAPVSAEPAADAGPQPGTPPDFAATALMPLIGRGLLGLSGAYFLRALTESGAVPPKAGVAAGLVYALAWLVWAARTPAARRVETAIYSFTAGLVLGPLVWEATLRFHAVSPGLAGAILVLFAAAGLAVSWRKGLLIVATIAALTSLLTAAGLLLATRDVLPFVFVFLALAAAFELSACLDHWLEERWLAAAAADLSVLLATWLVTNALGLPPAYAPIPHGGLLFAQIALVLIYLASTIVRTLVRGVSFTPFEIAQCAAAFAIGLGGGLRLSGQAHVVGAIALGCAAACYFVSFAVLERHGGRNFKTYSTFGLLLTLAGTLISLPAAGAAALWAVLAVACFWAAVFFGRLTLKVHGALYLLLAVAASGALRQAGDFLLGTASWPGQAGYAVLLGLASSVACYVLGHRGATPGLPLARFAVAGALAWLAAGTAAGLLTEVCQAWVEGDTGAAFCATLRTSVLAAAALLLAWSGGRWRKVELSRLIYPLMALAAYRLIYDDLHLERKAALMLSLLVYGAALIALPRLARQRA